MRVFEYRAMREEMAGGWRKLHDEELLVIVMNKF
jgi:hypothetical protein